jgi:hypothetical protein
MVLRNEWAEPGPRVLEQPGPRSRLSVPSNDLSAMELKYQCIHYDFRLPPFALIVALVLRLKGTNRDK